MVHYNPPFRLAQTRPPICPKCGSHRTEIVGRSHGGETVVVRCNACGERSRVTIPAETATASQGPEDANASATL
jgi:hypothetical protein